MATKQEEMMEKIRKLLKLSEGSSNIHEAQSAAARAQKLMMEYNIEQCVDRVSANVPQENIENFSNDPIEKTGRFENWKFSLLGAICKINSCQAVKSRTYKQGTAVYMVGRKTDVQTVKYIYQYLIREIEHLADRQRGMGRAYIASYKVGCVFGVNENLQKGYDDAFKEKYAEAASHGTQALMRIDNAKSSLEAKTKELDIWVKDNMKLRMIPIRFSNKSTEGMNNGYKDGKNIRTQVNGPALKSPTTQLED
jgi:hypothetical protein